MAVRVRSGGLLRSYLAPDVDAYTREVELDQGPISLRALLQRFGIPEGLVAFGLVDGRMLRLDDLVPDGCTLILQTPAGGG